MNKDKKKKLILAINSEEKNHFQSVYKVKKMINCCEK